jgi:hypothetical protein
MYLAPTHTNAQGFIPVKRPGTFAGLLPGGGLRYFERPATLSYFRPNFAMARGNYPGNQTVGLPNLGQLSVDPTTLALGIGALALGMFLFGGKIGPKLRKRKAGKLRQRREALSRQISELEA